jgi:hypothetical protein
MADVRDVMSEKTARKFVIPVADKSIDSSAEPNNASWLINVTLEPKVTEAGTDTVYPSSWPL